MSRVLIAGIGNVFLGDDGFGVEVLRRLRSRPLPDGVRAEDYGIRGVHLAYDLLDQNVDTLIMVDAVPTGEPPGTVSLLEVDDPALAQLRADPSPVDSHAMNPEAVIAALHAVGGRVGKIVLVGCQPETVRPGMCLSATVAAAVEPAVALTLETAAAAAREGVSSRA
jgi:hydrogenase maturation protease